MTPTFCTARSPTVYLNPRPVPFQYHILRCATGTANSVSPDAGRSIVNARFGPTHSTLALDAAGVWYSVCAALAQTPSPIPTQNLGGAPHPLGDDMILRGARMGLGHPAADPIKRASSTPVRFRGNGYKSAKPPAEEYGNPGAFKQYFTDDVSRQ